MHLQNHMRLCLLVENGLNRRSHEDMHLQIHMGPLRSASEADQSHAIPRLSGDCDGKDASQPGSILSPVPIPRLKVA